MAQARPRHDAPNFFADSSKTLIWAHYLQTSACFTRALRICPSRRHQGISLGSCSMSSLVEVVTVEHAPAAYAVHVTLFKEVQNAGFLHSQLLARNSDFEYAFIDASILASRAQLLAAVDRAVTASANRSLRTANVHSETVFSLSPSGNVCIMMFFAASSLLIACRLRKRFAALASALRAPTSPSLRFPYRPSPNRHLSRPRSRPILKLMSRGLLSP